MERHTNLNVSTAVKSDSLWVRSNVDRRYVSKPLLLRLANCFGRLFRTSKAWAGDLFGSDRSDGAG